jgi:hypothetical protein
VARYRRVLGDDHPHTLASADNLAVDLRALGEHEQARQLQERIRSQRGRRITHRDRAGNSVSHCDFSRPCPRGRRGADEPGRSVRVRSAALRLVARSRPDPPAGPSTLAISAQKP